MSLFLSLFFKISPQYPALNGLPSWSHTCLSGLALLHFHRVKFDVVETNNDGVSTWGQLPVLKFCFFFFFFVFSECGQDTGMRRGRTTAG